MNVIHSLNTLRQRLGRSKKWIGKVDTTRLINDQVIRRIESLAFVFIGQNLVLSSLGIVLNHTSVHLTNQHASGGIDQHTIGMARITRERPDRIAVLK